MTLATGSLSEAGLRAQVAGAQHRCKRCSGRGDGMKEASAAAQKANASYARC